MSRELQDIVDALATDLERGVAMDDRHLHLLAHSPHPRGVDELREQSIIRRVVDGAARDWVFSFGVEEALEPVRMAANPDVSALPRVCAPIRCRELLLGFLFVIDEDESMTDEQVALCARAAREAGDVLYEERFLKQRERSRDRQLTRQLLEGDDTARSQAAAALIEGGVLASQRAFAVSIGILGLDGLERPRPAPGGDPRRRAPGPSPEQRDRPGSPAPGGAVDRDLGARLERGTARGVRPLAARPERPGAVLRGGPARWSAAATRCTT